ncbi:MAG: glycosyltransferase family 4 protein [Rhizobiales bacterium]|nr:glycosyltransferase family 4 protein [Hyphomicrobiales bacterium]
MTPRILFNMPSQFAGHPSGVARMAFRLLEELIEIGGYRYVLRSPWTRDQLPRSLQLELTGVIVVPRPRILVLDVIQQRLTLPGLVRREKIDLVVNVDPFGAAAGANSRLTIVHDLYFKRLPEHFSWRARLTNDLIYRFTLVGKTEIVSVSNATQFDLEQFYPATRGHITTIHSAPLLLSDERRPTHSPIGGRYILAVGNATENKNFHVLAEAMVALHETDPDVTLVHVGADNSETMARSFERHRCPIRLVRFAGIEDCELAALYHHASCLCVPSLAEGFCLPILEAQICSCAVICSDRSAMPEIAGQGAILFDPTDPADLARNLKRLLDNPVEHARLTQLGRDNAARFSWNATARKYLGVFDRLLADRASG